MTATICPINPPGHDWQNGLDCRWCDATRTPEEAILSGLASRRGGDSASARALLDAYTTTLLAELAAVRAERDEAVSVALHAAADEIAGAKQRLVVKSTVVNILRRRANQAQEAAR